MDMSKRFLVWNERKQPFYIKALIVRYLFLRTEFAMESNERFWSMVAPKHFTDTLAGWPLQETRSLDWDFNLCFEPKTVSVLPKCNDNLLLISKSLTASNSKLSKDHTSWICLTWTRIAESSAYRKSLCLTIIGISLTLIENKRGPQIEPWGTPQTFF